MAKNFLAAVNDVLKRTSIIQGDAGELTTFTSTERQVDVDIAKAVWNDMIQHIYSLDDQFPEGSREGRFTLATNTREYDLDTEFEMMAIDEIRTETKGHIIIPYKGGFSQMWADQPDPADYTGQPRYYVINPDTGLLRLDTTPTSTENGDIYRYFYIRTLSMSATTDTFPFSDTVVECLTAGVAQLFLAERKKEFNEPIFDLSVNRALRYLRRKKIRRKYGVHG